MNQMNANQFVLADFQQEAVSALVEVVTLASDSINARPSVRRDVALRLGTSLLHSPTGSGKTLMLSRAMEALRGSTARPTAWFWFAPYSGLVQQTRESIRRFSPHIRPRDLYEDREAGVTKDGDVFVHTWASVAASNVGTRRIRRGDERSVSVDQMIEELVADGWFIGVIVDEAHLNFGMSAQRAAEFYIDVLKPDFTILATATPQDEKLSAFQDALGLGEISKITVDRKEVIEAGLNKQGVFLAYFNLSEKERLIVDEEEATYAAAWGQHGRIKDELSTLGITVTPLLLVQVEDQASGSENDPVARAKQKLIRVGVHPDSIAIHTSGEPDPDFHTLAFDDDVEVLIFKVAVATGFDAPRAWSLVSTRPNRGVEFGLQIVGRIMRVHPSIRPIHGSNKLLDHGYVFLSDPNQQVGLNEAAKELQAVESGIKLVTDSLDTVAVGDEVSDGFDGYRRSTVIDDEGNADTAGQSSEGGSRRPYSISAGDGSVSSPTTGGLFGEPTDDPHDQGTKGKSGKQSTRSHLIEDEVYDLREELGIPGALRREIMPRLEELPDLIDKISEAFVVDPKVLLLISQKNKKLKLVLQEIFSGDTETSEQVVRISNDRVAQSAQQSFRFNDSIDPRRLKRSLVEKLRRRCDEEGIEFTENDLRRAIDLISIHHPEILIEAKKTALARSVKVSEDEKVPDKFYGPSGLRVSKKGAYGVFPHNMNKPETAFAELLDSDDTGTVLWWLRNPENFSWACQIVLPNGHRHFPDFVVGIAGRSTPDGIVLVEIKDDGVTGRLHSVSNQLKMRTQHRAYKDVVWLFEDAPSGDWYRAEYHESGRIIPGKKFEVPDLKWE